MEIKGIVFDKDGTLMQVEPFWFGVVTQAAKTVVSSFKGTQALQDHLIYLAGFKKNGTCISESLVIKGTNADIASAWKIYLESENYLMHENFEASVIRLLAENYCSGCVRENFPVQPVFQNLKSMGLRIGIATSDHRQQTLYCLEQLGILPYVDTVRAADDGFLPKPCPDMLFSIANEWGIAVESILMVGDSQNDMTFADNAGAAGLHLIIN